MRLKISCVLMLIIHLAFGQDEFIITYDYQNFFQTYSDSECTDEFCFVIGTTVCNSGGCGVISKYNQQGDLLFLKELPSIDINSRNCMTIKGDSIYITALYNFEPGIITLIFDFEGNLLDEKIIQRDPELDLVWPNDVLYLEDYYLVALNENYENESRHEAIYKINYEGELIQHARLPNFFRSEIYTLDLLENGNLFVSQPYIEDSTCIYHEDLDDIANADILYEMDLESLEIIKFEDKFCHSGSFRSGNDFTILPNNQLIRTVQWTNPDDPLERRAANIVYDEDWNEIFIHKYDNLELLWPFSNGTQSNRIYTSKNQDYYYVVAIRLYDFIDLENYYIDQIIEKWNLNHELIWKRTISSPITHKRLLLSSLEEQDDHIILTGAVNYDLEDLRRYDFAIMSLTQDGCFNGDCNDTIYVGEPLPVNTEDFILSQSINISPNPVDDFLSINTSVPFYRLELISSDGQVVKSLDVASTITYSLDMSLLDAGMYYVRLQTNKGVISEKLIKI